MRGLIVLLAAVSACVEQADRAPVVDTLLPVTASPLDTASMQGMDSAATTAMQAPLPVDTNVGVDSLRLIIPVEGVVASELRDTYGDPRTGHAHEALDIMAPRGTRVLSATEGRLTKLFLSKQGGIMVYAADPSDRYILMYGHLDRYADGLVEGMPLTRGQLIGYVGSSGDASASGPHLHFAIARGKPSVAWWKGDPVNPYPLLSH
jgi:murein DD-endopeptidase MepM/ murein hydrolase activator NlpD